MTTTTQKTNPDALTQQTIQRRKRDIKQLANTYCEMHGWNHHEVLCECLANLVEMGDFTTHDAIERLNTQHEEYMEDI